MATATASPVTCAEFEQLPETEGVRSELRHGEIVQLAPPKYRHHAIRHQILRLLLASEGLVDRAVTEIGFRALPQHEYRVPVARRRRTPSSHTNDGAPSRRMAIWRQRRTL